MLPVASDSLKVNMEPLNSTFEGLHDMFREYEEFIRRDLATAEVELPTERGKRQIIIASAYFPGEEEKSPPEEVKNLISWCNKKNRQLILGCDANSHNIVWGSTDTNKRDPRVKHLPLMSSPVPTVAISIVYLIFVTILGPRHMRDKKPYELKSVLVFYNAFQVILSSWIFYGMGKAGWLTGSYNYRCQPIGTSESDETYKAVMVAYVYYLSKFMEFADTILFILRKKNNQITILHLYHHSIMPFGTWIGVKYAPIGQMTLLSFLNSFIHIVMYSYYLLSGMGPIVQKYLWWKKYLTRLQLIQFVLITTHAIQALLTGCNFPKWISCYIIFQSTSFFILFLNFYLRSYAQKRSKRTSNGLSTGNSIHIKSKDQ